MTAVEFEVFDDLLIGNFMKTTLHEMRSLYDDDFNFAVTKFGDNGRVSTYHELDNYLKEYRRRAGAADWYCQRASQMVRRICRESRIYIGLRNDYIGRLDFDNGTRSRNQIFVEIIDGEPVGLP
jgi:hypothetical protein